MGGYGLEFVEGGTVLDLRVLVIGEEGGPEAADYGLGVPVLDCEGCHLHLDDYLINITNQKAISPPPRTPIVNEEVYK